MTTINENEITLESIRYISMKSLTEISSEQLAELELEAEREFFRAQITRDWLEAAIRLKRWSNKDECKQVGKRD